jgi:AcrR family transcriptional regulator
MTRAEKKAATREALLDAAEAVVAKVGMDAAKVEEIAEAAGLTVGAIYSNFANKADLMTALVEERAPSARMPELSGATLQEAFTTFGEAVGRAAADEDGSFALSLQFLTYALNDELVRERWAPQREASRAATAAHLTEFAAARGQELPLPADELVEALSAVGWGLAMARRMVGPELLSEQMCGKVFALLAGCPTPKGKKRA